MAEPDEASRNRRIEAAIALMQMVHEARQGQAYSLEEVKKEILKN